MVQPLGKLPTHDHEPPIHINTPSPTRFLSHLSILDTFFEILSYTPSNTFSLDRLLSPGFSHTIPDTGAIVGIAVGVTAGLVATAAVGYYTYVHQCLRKSITSV